MGVAKKVQDIDQGKIPYAVTREQSGRGENIKTDAKYSHGLVKGTSKDNCRLAEKVKFIKLSTENDREIK